jgi:hypothetical protein
MVLVGEADHAGVPRPPERRRVERLDRIGAVARLVGEQPAEHEALGAQRVRHERVGRDGDAALIVDLGDRRAHRPERLDLGLDPQREQVAAEGRHLLADDHFEREAAVARHRSPGDCGIDALVIGDGNHVELARARDVIEDLDDAGGPVGGEGVDMQVGAPQPVGHAAARPRSRSGHSGWKIASHCSGAAATTRSKARASASRNAWTRSRRVPSAGNGPPLPARGRRPRHPAKRRRRGA